MEMRSMGTGDASTGRFDRGVVGRTGWSRRRLIPVVALLLLLVCGLLPSGAFAASAAPAVQVSGDSQATAGVCSERPYACWMADNAAVIGQRPLNQVIMPFSHDTGTYGFDAGSYSRTQDDDLYTQLIAGTRGFDIRALVKGDKLVIYHGDTTSDLDLQNLYDDIARFTKSPGAEREILYLHIHFGGGPADVLQRYCNTFNTTFAGLFLTPSDLLTTDGGAAQAGNEQTFKSLNEIWALPNHPRLIVDDWCGYSTTDNGNYYANQGSSGCISWADSHALLGRRNQAETGGEPVPYLLGCEGMIGLGNFVPGLYTLYLQVSGPIPGLGT